MQYTIPEIMLEPHLDVCQASIHEVANAIVQCEKQIIGKLMPSSLLIEADRDILSVMDFFASWEYP